MSTAREVAIGLGGYGAYLAVRRAVWNPRGQARAAANAQAVLDVERTLGLAVEHRVQAVALRRPVAVDLLNAGYAAGNVALSVGWLILLHRRGDPQFVRERRAAVFALVGALPVFLAFPTAPPRTRPEFADTLSLRGLDLEHPALVRFYNPVAAMPSQHVAFAVISGLGLARRRRRAAWRIAWRSYPAAVAGVVVATGNHYVLDVAAGAVLGVLARRLTR